MIAQDLCEHANAEIEYLPYAIKDDAEDLPTLVCPDCGLEEIQESGPGYEQ